MTSVNIEQLAIKTKKIRLEIIDSRQMQNVVNLVNHRNQVVNEYDGAGDDKKKLIESSLDHIDNSIRNILGL